MPASPYYTAFERTMMSAMWADGVSIRRIAEAVGRPYWGVVQFMKYHREYFPFRQIHPLKPRKNKEAA